MLPGVPERATHDYKRHGTSSLYAALDVATGQVIGRLHSRHRAIEFKQFLQTSDREVPADLDVHVVLDNSSTHKTPAIQKWLAAHPRFVLHFTPTSSSWLNLVERWFAELTSKKLRRGAHRSVRDLNTDIRAWIETWNDDPKPYVWTKTADQIRESIARYCQPITTLEDQFQRGLQVLADPRQELGGLGAVEDPVVAGEGELHRVADHDLAVADDRLR
jgi:transposase